MESQIWVVSTLLISIVLIVLTIVKLKFHPFLALLLASFFVGAMMGMGPLEMVNAIESGIGGTLGFLAAVIGLGTILGKMMEVSGVAERIGLNEFYEEYAIHDYELPFEIDEYTPIEEVNRLCEMVEDLPEYIQDNLRELQGYFSSIEDLCDHQDDIIYYPGCEDMADVARQMVEEGYISVPDHLIYYFDYEAYGRDLSMEGTFVETRNGVFEIAV